jgi:lysophospholipase L1-like esterase
MIDRGMWPAALALVALALGGQQTTPRANPTVVPQPRPGAWLELHESFVAIAARGDVDLLFLGDSLNASWMTTARAVWDRHYAPRKAANFAIGGDRTQHLLWRLDHGELEGVTPRVIVVMIGTNNIPDDTEDQVVDGVKAVVDRIKRKLPASKLLLLGVTPRGLSRKPGQASTAPDLRVARLNLKLARLEDVPTLEYLDIGSALLDVEGRLVQSIQPDFLHFSRKGYQIWADAMEPTLWRMMEGE